MNVPASGRLILIHVEFARKIRSQHEKCRCDRDARTPRRDIILELLGDKPVFSVKDMQAGLRARAARGCTAQCGPASFLTS